MTHLSSLE